MRNKNRTSRHQKSNKTLGQLKLSVRQNERFFGNKELDIMKRKDAGDLFPEYYVLRVNDFDNIATTPLDEWIEFLKTGNISAEAKAPGLSEARERLRVDALSESDKQAYYRHMESIRHMKSLFDTSRDEGYEEGRAEGKAERSLEIAIQMKKIGMTDEQITLATGLTIEAIQNK